MIIVYNEKMERFEKWKKEIGNRESGFFHHAYFLEGEKEKNISDLQGFLKKEFEIDHTGNPDFHQYFSSVLLLENAQEIRREESRRAVAPEARKLFFIAMDQIHHVAGDSLLKTLEEPHEGSLFFFFSSSSRLLSSTLRSRFLVISQKEATTSDEEMQRVRKFLENSKKERLEMFETMIKDKDRAGARIFLRYLEKYLYEQTSLFKADTETLRALEEVGMVLDYIEDTSSSVKLLLEHIALVLPSK